MSIPPILSIKDTNLNFGDKVVFSNAEMYINQGDKISLVGKNGSGKSTLLKTIANIIEPDSGEKFVQPGIKVSYMPQDTDLSKYKTLRDVITANLTPEEEYKADILIDKLNILEDQETSTASGGEKRKASLAMALVSEPDILLLDEPTNHLDIKTIETLEEIIKEFKGAVLLISHDRSFLMNTTTVTFWLDRGIIRRNNKGFSHFEEWQEEVINEEVKEQERIDRRLSEETEWLHKGVTARRKRNQGRLRRLHDLRKQKREQVNLNTAITFSAEGTDFRSKLVAQAKNISKKFSDRTIIENFSTTIIKGDKIGIVGPNGSGKSTLLKLLTGEIEPDSGFIRIGKNLNEVYFDQNRATLDPKKTLWKTLCNEGDHIMVHGKYRHVISYLKDFLFKPEQAHTPVSALSGGEKNRLLLALTLAQESNFLILDEPTNDLDMDTLDLLQEVLVDYNGTIIVVSHDRSFIDNIVSSIIYIPGDGTISEHVGSYSDLIEKIKTKENSKPIKKDFPIQENRIKKRTVKLSYNQKRLLETLPKEIENIENNIKEIEKNLSDGELYSSNPEKFASLSEELVKMTSSLEEKEFQWLEIELLQEEIEE